MSEFGSNERCGSFGAAGICGCMVCGGLIEGDLLWFAAGECEFDAVVDEPKVIGGVCLHAKFLKCRNVGIAAGENGFDGGRLVAVNADGDSGFFGRGAACSIRHVQVEVLVFGGYECGFEYGRVSGGG